MGEKRFLKARNIIIIIISCILIGASVTGITLYLKDRGEAEAVAEGEPAVNLPETGDNGESQTPPGENQGETENEDVTKPETTEQEGTADSGTSSSNTNYGIGGGTTEEEIFAGITETTVLEERKVFEDLKLSWTTIAIPAITTNMGVYKPELKIEKTAVEIIKAKLDDGTDEIENEVIEVDPENKPKVRPGDVIIFKIEVSNIGNYKATNVVVTDSLDVIFENQIIEAGQELAKIETLDYGKKATLRVAYEVTKDDVNAKEIIDDVEVEKNIYNIAYATDGKTTVEDDDYMPVNPDVEIIGSKTWDDADNQDGKRPESITIRLLANGEEVKTATVTAEDQWTWQFTELPVCEAGQKIEYTIAEDEVTEYETKINGYNVTNSYTPQKTSISGKKTWNDNNNQYGNRPDSITINLWANKAWVAEKNITMQDNWAWNFEDLPLYESGILIDYTIIETPVLGYTSQVNNHDVTNSIDTVNVSGIKTWEHKGNNDTPSSITVNLLENGTEIAEKTITANDNWTYEFKDLPKYKNSKLVEYTVTEDYITDYVATYTTTTLNNGDKTINIKNTWEQDITGKIVTIKQTPVPLDVIFVLDISSSMLEKDGDNITRAQDMVEATNEAIKELMKNANNRVSVVLFNSDVYELTDSGSLKHYNADENGNYITYKTVNETYVGGKITFSNKNTVNVSTSAYREGSLKCGTYTQGGIKKATQIFNNSKGTSGTRKPVIILLTDGDPTHYDPNLNYSQYGTKYPTVGEGIAKLRYITAEYYAYTMKTMENCKSEITGFYGGKNCELYTVGINMKGSMAKALLQPSSDNISSLIGTTNISPEIHNHGDKGEKTQYSITDSDGVWRKDAEYYKYQAERLNSFLTSGITSISTNYANKAYTESTSGDISENFDDIINTITETETTIITSEHYGKDRRVKLEGFNPSNKFALEITQNGSKIIDTSNISEVEEYIIQDQNDGNYYLTLINLLGKINIELTYYK